MKNRYDKDLFVWNYIIMFCIQFIAILVMIGTYEPSVKLEDAKTSKQAGLQIENVMNDKAVKEVTARSREVRIGIPYEMEGRIVGEIYARALSDRNMPISRVYLAEGESPDQACRENKIDLYPEYILPVYKRLYKAGAVGNVYEEMENYFLKDSYLYTSVEEYYKSQLGIELLIPAPFNAGKGMVMTRMISKRYGVRTISALCNQAQYIRYVKDKNTNNLNKTTKNSTNQLTEIYGNFHFQSEEVFPTEICYFIMKTHFGDVMEMSLTDPMIVKEQFVRLVDDKVAYLSNQVSPAIRQDIYEIYPEIKTILEETMGGLTTSVITKLKAAVEYESESYGSVVNDYFDSSD
ncbi:L-proline glycine betaine binding ABC transporter protein ProX / Osmotic adaptation [Lachnospiraceae bacterium KM106-2]|nr:L-proline glycine betaine binding ABC transporter protein ProX / Osmotic adaptation [Lachnospiraceae bacterium KM106-2]